MSGTFENVSSRALLLAESELQRMQGVAYLAKDADSLLSVEIILSKGGNLTAADVLGSIGGIPMVM